ncbi:MAG: hypothetical protein IKR86_11305 [Candidatus Methanomethylophilaceae archaeon]|nr:hypothetical protein [Candidatus Methanomethylophilaceae archaeon]
MRAGTPYVMAEPYLAPTGPRVLLMHEGGGVEDKGLADIETMAKNQQGCRCDPEELRSLVRSAPWALPGELPLGSGAGDWEKADLGGLIRSCFDEVKGLAQDYLYLVDEKMFDVMALYVVSSYLHEELACFPRILVVGSSHTGKSKIGTILSLAYRGVNAGNASMSAAFRTIDRYGSSLFLDEVQDLPRGTLTELLSVFKNGFERGGVFMRTSLKSYEPEAFRVDAFMAVGSKKMSVFPEDVLNRAFVINTFPCEASSKRRDLDQGSPRMAGIRTRLAYMRFVYLYQRESAHGEVGKFPATDYYDLHGLFESCGAGIEAMLDGMLREEDPLHGVLCRCSDLGGRSLSMLGALLPVAVIAGAEDSLVEALLQSLASERVKEMTSLHAEIFNTWMDLAHLRVPSPASASALRRAALEVSLREMREAINNDRRGAGDALADADELRTHSLREPMELMGFRLDYAGRRGSQTFVVDEGDFERMFDAAMKRYGEDRYREEYAGLREAELRASAPEGAAGTGEVRELKKLDREEGAPAAGRVARWRSTSSRSTRRPTSRR